MAARGATTHWNRRRRQARIVRYRHGDGGNGSADGSTGSGPMGGGTILESLLALLLSERVGIDVAGTTVPSPAAAAVRDELQRRLSGGGSDVAA